MGYRVRAVVLRAGYRMLVEHPPVLGGMVLAAGYCWHGLIRAPQAEPIARRQLREEQRGMLLERLGRGGHSTPPLHGGGPAYWMTTAEPALPMDASEPVSAASV